MRARCAAARRLRLLAAVAALVFASCGPGAGANCPFELPVCPDPAPSYANGVSAIIQTKCVGCHGPGGQEAIRPYMTWQDIDGNHYAQSMQQALLACRMPPADAPQLSDQDKQTLLAWLTCGAPNN